MTATRVPAADVPPGTVTGSGDHAVGNNGEYFAVGRRCRHLRADLAGGSIDADGCLVCPWHQAKYDVRTGQMVRGPQGVYAKIPGLGDVDWPRWISALTDAGFDGPVCIEVEDEAFMASLETRKQSLRISRNVLRPLIG